jgi:hypothetical protein
MERYIHRTVEHPLHTKHGLQNLADNNFHRSNYGPDDGTNGANKSIHQVAIF